jgi:LmbE family N-acetylglucosaminyl deacetylase
MRILITSPHPDDIEPQMGGTIARYTKQGHQVLMLNAIIPCQDTDGKVIEGAKEKRKAEANRAAKILGADLILLDQDPYRLQFNRDLVQTIDRIVQEFSPDIVYTCWVHDSHQDHQAMARATFVATRKNISNLYMFEPVIPGGLVPEMFNASSYVDITDTLDQKIKSIEAYESQTALYKNWVEASVGRSRHRGFEINVDYAEAFQVVREIKKI